jgi:hypothetical protein
MAKQNLPPEPTTSPEINPDHINLDVDDASPSDALDPNTTVAEAQAAAEPTVSPQEEDIYQQASKDMASDESSPRPEKKPKRSKKKILLLLFFVLLLAGSAAAGWYFFVRKKPATVQNQAPQNTETSQATIGYEPDTVAYSFRESEDLPDTLFWRLATGGDRTQVVKLGRGENLIQSDTHGQYVVYATDTAIHASSDGGRTYTSVFELSAGDQVTSLKISSQGGRVAAAILPDKSTKNTVKSINLSDGKASDLFTNDTMGVFIDNWNESKQTIIYQEGCYGCDGNMFNLRSINLSDEKVTKLLESVDGNEVANYAVSFDGSKVVFVKGTADNDGGSLENSVVAPYKVQLLDVVKNSESSLATIGTAGEKNANGTLRSRNILVGFLAGTVTPYYTDEAVLYTVSGSKPNKFYESNTNIFEVLFVSDSTVIASSGSFEDFALTHFDVAANTGTVVLQGDANTTLFGVTTK